MSSGYLNLPTYMHQLVYLGADNDVLNPSNDSKTAWATSGLGKYVARPLLRMIYQVAMIALAALSAVFHMTAVLVLMLPAVVSDLFGSERLALITGEWIGKSAEALAAVFVLSISTVLFTPTWGGNAISFVATLVIPSEHRDWATPSIDARAKKM
jgi:hypothetical protein